MLERFLMLLNWICLPLYGLLFTVIINAQGVIPVPGSGVSVGLPGPVIPDPRPPAGADDVDCQGPIAADDFMYVDIDHGNFEIAWLAFKKNGCYEIEVNIYHGSTTFVGGIPSNAPMVTEVFQIDYSDASNYADFIGLPPLWLAWNFNVVPPPGILLPRHYFLTINIYQYYSANCNGAPAYDCPGGGPNITTATALCSDPDVIIDICGLRPPEGAPIQDILNYISCLEALGCPFFITQDDGPGLSWGPGKKSINDQITNGLSSTLHPNPATNEINLSFPNSTEGYLNVQVVDMHGKVVHEVLNRHYYAAGYFDLTTDISGLAKGTYFVQIANPSGVEVLKFVKLD